MDYPHPIAAFMAWLFTVGQAIAFTPLVVDTPVPDQVFVIATSVFGLFLPAVMITWIVEPRGQADVSACPSDTPQHDGERRRDGCPEPLHG